MENSSARWETTAGGVGGVWGRIGGATDHLAAPTSTNEMANGRVGDGPGQGLGDAMVRRFVVRWQPLRYARRMTGSQFSGV